MTKKTYLPIIKRAFDDLIKLRQSLDLTKDAHKYIAISISNTAALLTAPFNSIVCKKDAKRVRFSDEGELKSLVVAVKRSFLSSIHATTEIVIDIILKEKGIEVKNSKKSNTEKKLEKLMPIDSNIEAIINNLLKMYEEPSFTDKLNALLKNSSLNKEQKAMWRNFFEGLRIARNKVSHTNPSLTDHEKKVFSSKSLAPLIHNGNLNVMPEFWHQIAAYTLDFFEQINRGMNGD